MLLLLACLAVYRVARMVSQEDGPFDAFTRLRAAVGQSSWIGRGFHCFMCVSVYVAAVAAVFLVLTDRAAWIDIGLLWLGIAGGASALYQVFR